MAQYWINGTPGRLVDITDRGLAYGDGLFETIAIRHSAARFLDLHLDRLYAGAARLKLAAPDRDSLHTQLVTAATGLDEGVLKLIMTRGSGPRGYAPVQYSTSSRRSPGAWKAVRHSAGHRSGCAGVRPSPDETRLRRA